MFDEGTQKKVLLCKNILEMFKFIDPTFVAVRNKFGLDWWRFLTRARDNKCVVNNQRRKVIKRKELSNFLAR